MNKEFERDIFHGHLIKGKPKDALEYLKSFPEKRELYDKYISFFEELPYPEYEIGDALNKALYIYRQYYRDVFYLEAEEKKAAENMRDRLSALFGIDNKNTGIDDIEYNILKPAFSDKGYNMLGGLTGGFCGPYIWKTTEEKNYRVELPEVVKEYRVNLLDGFISLSWLNFISLGEIGTGGWTDGDGIIYCVKSSYDLNEEAFNISLLKHEAQHAADMEKYESMFSEDLEYRAKLVELIYSRKRRLLEKFVSEGNNSNEKNGHAMAAYRIGENFTKKLGLSLSELSGVSAEEVQRTAAELFGESSGEIERKYRKK